MNIDHNSWVRQKFKFKDLIHEFSFEQWQNLLNKMFCQSLFRIWRNSRQWFINQDVGTLTLFLTVTKIKRRKITIVLFCLCHSFNKFLNCGGVDPSPISNRIDDQELRYHQILAGENPAFLIWSAREDFFFSWFRLETNAKTSGRDPGQGLQRMAQKQHIIDGKHAYNGHCP